ncbi:MAG: coproporphyrinogen III oxidase, partial [Planctomycetales bacterium]
EEFLAAGYSISSAYTLVKNADVRFSYRDELWKGSDLLATGIASFGHVSGVHYQNLPEWKDYNESLERGELPLSRALQPTTHQMLIREMILQLKKGHLDAGYFREKFNVEIVDEWKDAWNRHVEDGFATVDGDRIELTREGLLRADALLPPFFEPEHQGVRYT